MMILKTFPQGTTEPEHLQQFLISLLYLTENKYESGESLFNGIGHLAACFYSQSGFEALMRANSDYLVVFTDMVDKVKTNHHVFLNEDKASFKTDLSISMEPIDDLLAPAEIAISGYGQREKEHLRNDMASVMMNMTTEELHEMALEFIELPNIEEYQRVNNGLILK